MHLRKNPAEAECEHRVQSLVDSACASAPRGSWRKVKADGGNGGGLETASMMQLWVGGEANSLEMLHDPVQSRAGPPTNMFF